MLITLTGLNNFLIQEELKKRTEAFVREYGDFGLEKVDGEEASYERLAESLQSLPFLASHKLVILRSPSAQKAFMEKFESLVPTISDQTDVVIVEPKLDKRTAYFKAVKKLTDFHEFNELDESQLKIWARDYVKAQGGSISAGDASFIVERVGARQELLRHELDKLMLYDPAVSRQTIELLTEPTPQSTIFELIDAAFRGEHVRAAKLYAEQRALKVEPQQILAMMAWQLHVLALVKTAGSRSADEIAQEAKINPYVVRKTQGLARELTLQQVKALVARTLELDLQLKSQSIDADEALQHLLLYIRPD